jgi:hypothetical protein
MLPISDKSFVSTPTYEPVEAVSGGRSTNILVSRVLIWFEFDTNIPLLIPAPFELTVMVQPFTLLNENVEDDKAPVPLARTPVTLDDNPTPILELSTVRTHVRNFDL